MSFDSPPPPEPAGPLTVFTSGLMKHLAHEITVFRNLQYRLDEEDLTDAELRRELGRIFDDGLDSYAIARGFHDAIERVEARGETTLEALTGEETALAVMSGWIENLQTAADTVVTDLMAIDALIGVIERRDDTDSSTRVAFESIRSLAHSAIGRLDEARSPRRERDES